MNGMDQSKQLRRILDLKDRLMILTYELKANKLHKANKIVEYIIVLANELHKGEIENERNAD